MSLLTPGSRCSLCQLVDFLPFNCQVCSKVYCKDHIHSPLHTCTQSTIDSSTPTSKPGKLDRGKRECEFGNCHRESIESIAGLGGGGGDEDIAREVRCKGCGGGFCVEHRSQTSHSCPAPLDHNTRHDAFLERRSKAREIVSKQFPEYQNRVIPKPPPGKDVIRVKPKEEERLPPSVQGQAQEASISKIQSALSQTAKNQNEGSPLPSISTLKPRPKSKAEKLWDIHLKKIRMTSEPLSLGLGGRVDTSRDRKFFEWQIDLDQDQVKNWARDGKWDSGGKLNRGWVYSDMPIGKMLDILIERGKVKRSMNGNDENQSLHLLSLYPTPDGERQITKLELSKPAKDQIVDGSLIILIRGKWE